MESVNLNLEDIDGVVITHCHYDHIGGLPELAVGRKLKVDVICTENVERYLAKNNFFRYIFDNGWAQFKRELLGSIEVEFVKVPHSPFLETSAVIMRIGDKRVAYIPDISKISSLLLKKISQCNPIIFDGTFIEESKLGHISVRSSLSLLTKDKIVLLTHINHSEDEIKYQNLQKNYDFHLASDFDTITLNC